MTVADAGVRPPAERTRAPWHLWLVGGVSLLWNAFGAFDYLATQMRWEPYMGNYPEEQLAYFYGFPAWAVAFWALGVWGSFFGSIALLLRKRWAVWLFGVSLIGLVGTTIYSYALSEGAEMMGAVGAIFSAVIWIIVIALFLYARVQARKGVLR